MIERLNKEEPDDPLVTRRVGDWIAASDKEASIDAALKGEPARRSPTTRPSRRAWRSCRTTRWAASTSTSRPRSRPSAVAQAQALRMFGLDELDFAGAWAKARDDGAEVAGVVQGEGADKLLGASEEYSSDLLELVPADAFAFISFMGTGIGEQVGALRENPLYGSALKEFERETGVTVAEVLRSSTERSRSTRRPVRRSPS